MAWFTYPIKATCDNCGKESTINVKKGVPVAEFIKENKAKCPNCDCIVAVKEYKTQWYQ